MVTRWTTLAARSLVRLLAAGLCLAATIGAAQSACDDVTQPAISPCPHAPVPGCCTPQDCYTCTPGKDDDGDCLVDEERLDGTDDDGDTLIDEDVSCSKVSYFCNESRARCPDALVTYLFANPVRPTAPSIDAVLRMEDCSAVPPPPEELVTVDVLPATFPGPDESCGRFIVDVKVKHRGTGSVWLQGPAVLTYSRHWESLMLDPSGKTWVVHRFTMRADLEQESALPQSVRFPCARRKGQIGQQPFDRVFFYGILDVAEEAGNPSNRRVALALTHAVARMSHPNSGPSSPPPEACGNHFFAQRPLHPGDTGDHAGIRWLLVGPAATGADFVSAPTMPVPIGNVDYGITHGTKCNGERAICTTYLSNPQTTPDECGEALRVVVQCAYSEETGGCKHIALDSLEGCHTMPPGNKTISIHRAGRWVLGGAPGPYPDGMDVAFVEGVIGCDNPPDGVTPYFYGAETHYDNVTRWVGPPDAIDVVDNVGTRVNAFGFLVGGVEWVNGQFQPFELKGVQSLFRDQNPELEDRVLTPPCVATAVIAPATIDYACNALPPTLTLDALPGSNIVNCCQCLGMEFQWSKLNPASGLFVPLCTWDDEIGGTGTDATCSSIRKVTPQCGDRYQLQVRCKHNGNTCTSPAITVTVNCSSMPTVSAGADFLSCPGVAANLSGTISGGTCSSYSYEWTESGVPLCSGTTTGLAPCALGTSVPSGLHVYTLRGWCPLSPSCTATDTVTMEVPTMIADAGPDRVSCNCGNNELNGTGTFPGCTDLVYRWRQVPGGLWQCGDDFNWVLARSSPPEFPCSIVEGCGGTFELQVKCLATQCIVSDTMVVSLSPGISPSGCSIQTCASLTPTQKVGDDDGDGSTNEEIKNTLDDDGDTCTDEDIDCTACQDVVVFAGCAKPEAPSYEPGLEDGTIGSARWFTWDASTGTAATQASGTVSWQVTNHFRQNIDLSIDLAVGTSHLKLEAVAVYSRNWQVAASSLIPGVPPTRDICVRRYLVRADLGQMVGSLPVPPCFDDFGRAFLSGYLDVAHPCNDPTQRRHSLVLTHSLGDFSHCADSARPLTTPDRHSTVGWTIVAPDDVSVPFTFDPLPLAPSGTTGDEVRRRMSWTTNPERETPIKAADLGPWSPTALPMVRTGAISIDSLVQGCSCELLSARSTCGNPTDTLISVPLGRWTGTLFPGSQAVQHVEGGVTILHEGGSDRGYLYGNATTSLVSGSQSPAPPVLVDVIDNRLHPLQEPLIGAPGIFRDVYGLYPSYSEHYRVTCP